MNIDIDIDYIVEEFKRNYPVEGIVDTSTVGDEDPKAPEHEQEMDCLWIGLHRKNKVKIPRMFRGFRIYTELVSRIAA